MTGDPPFLHPVVVGGGAWRVGLGLRGGLQRGRAPGAARHRPCGAARRSCACAGPLPRAWLSSLWTVSCCWGVCLVLALGGCACREVCGSLQLGAALIDVRLDVGPLPLRSSSPTVAGCRLGGFPVGRDQWGGERIVGGVLPRINIGTNV
jgi:hypothetical protein